ncbi:MAG TPA: hypothetical protein VGQ17_03775 [Gemmatimonadales bacterium]|nr:hypothetical protein [Gemmatimonadales bacterium]
MSGQLRLPGAVLFGALLAGCYTLQPVQGVDPQVGSRLAFDVNDAGRAALGGTMGPEIAQVEGQLIEKENGSYLLAVSTVRLLRGGEQAWSGEPVRLKPEYLGPAYVRRFSTGRTIGLGLAVVGGVSGFLVTRSLLGSGADPGGNPGDTVNTRRIRP